ncbi:Putative yippee-like protein Os10g0369500 [Linum perenne]
MGRLFLLEVNGARVFKCKCCNVDFASYEDIVSKEFQGRYGRAYLFRKVVNVSLGASEERNLSSGMHVVNDIYCSSCQQILGWKYVSPISCLCVIKAKAYAIVLFSYMLAEEKALEETQKYKEGLFILEKERMLKDGW